MVYRKNIQYSQSLELYSQFVWHGLNYTNKNAFDHISQLQSCPVPFHFTFCTPIFCVQAPNAFSFSLYAQLSNLLTFTSSSYFLTKSSRSHMWNVKTPLFTLSHLYCGFLFVVLCYFVLFWYLKTVGRFAFLSEIQSWDCILYLRYLWLSPSPMI